VIKGVLPWETVEFYHNEEGEKKISSFFSKGWQEVGVSPAGGEGQKLHRCGKRCGGLRACQLAVLGSGKPWGEPSRVREKRKPQFWGGGEKAKMSTEGRGGAVNK